MASQQPSQRPDCWSCQHFAVSWDPRLPYSCKLMGFKSKRAPCLEVASADGRSCMGYSRKALLVANGRSGPSGVNGGVAHLPAL